MRKLRLKTGNHNISHHVFSIPGMDFVLQFPGYMYWRLRQLVTYLWIIAEIISEVLTAFKDFVVREMFWGRGRWYKSSFHLLVVLFTSTLLISGVAIKFGGSGTTQAEGLSISYGNSGNLDILQQGATLKSVLAVDAAEINFQVRRHVVVAGETLQQIAEKYSVSKDTVKWANSRLLSPFNDEVRVGWELLIPQMDGVLYEVKKGETLDTVLAITNGNRFDVVELNGLVPPSYALAEGQRIFVPNGNIKAPPLIPAPGPRRSPGGGGYVSSGVIVDGVLGNLPAGTFDDPLTHSRCAGYVWMRGVSAWHEGVDLSKGGGCPVQAAAAGTVIQAGWLNSDAGYGVIIDHGSGVITKYYHSDGNVWVRRGDYVAKGQDIMYMGTTGNSTGVHLHFEMRYYGSVVDPAPFVPYRRP